MPTFAQKKIEELSNSLLLKCPNCPKDTMCCDCGDCMYKRDRRLWYMGLIRRAEEQVIVEEEKKRIRDEMGILASVKIAVTICPEVSNSYTLLFDIIERLRECECLISGNFVVEQRSKGDEEEHGWHLHLALTANVRPGKVRQYILQKLKRKPTISAFVVAKTMYNNDWIENYMSGRKGKSNEDKIAKSQKDKVLRLKYGLKDMYQFREGVV